MRSKRSIRKVTARFTWDILRVSFWFAPLVMSLAAILLARVMNWVDGHISNEILENSNLVLSGTPGELRAILISMATTVLATAGVVFTLLTLPLSTVAAQYGSRLLRVFLGDRTTQIVLGMFVGTFVYCVAAATSIPSVKVQPEGPHITATVGVFLMLATFGSLIALVQHISTMLQAPNIAAAAGAELVNVVRAEIPEEVRSGGQTGQETVEAQTPGSAWSVKSTEAVESTEAVKNPLMETDGYPIRVRSAGYLQYIDPDSILTLARERDLVIRLLRQPGHFVWSEAVVALVWPASRVDEQLDKQIRRAFLVGNQRTPTQDVEYAVNQLVEMAVRAMSPAINDPFTAMTCLDYLGEGLALFIQQGEKGSHYYDLGGQLRLVLEPVTFKELLETAFDMLRHASCGNASVLLHMLDVIDAISQEAISLEDRAQLLRHVCLIQAESEAGGLVEQDQQLVQLSAEALQTKLKATM